MSISLLSLEPLFESLNHLRIKKFPLQRIQFVFLHELLEIEHLLNPYMMWSLNILSQAHKKPFLKQHPCIFHMYMFAISMLTLILLYVKMTLKELIYNNIQHLN